MKIQQWLRNNDGDLELLKEQYGIKSNCHPDGRVILNYHQIESDKRDLMVQECRGLVLDRNNNFAVVAKGFSRFFNIGEVPELEEQFDWSDFTATHKEDGSFVEIYFWNNRWCINTRNSFGDQPMPSNTGLIWSDLVKRHLPLIFYRLADPQCTYIFELCSPWNKVVRSYNTTLFLLSVFHNKYHTECWEYVNFLRKLNVFSFPRMLRKLNVFSFPRMLRFDDIECVKYYLNKQARLDKTFEGLVLRDCNGLRLKLKSKSYIELHRLANNSDPCHINNIIPLIVNGELEELYLYFPETKPYVENIIEEIEEEWNKIERMWYCYKDEPSQKKFALAIKDSKHSSVLFKARKLNMNPRDIFFTTDYLLRFFKRSR